MKNCEAEKTSATKFDPIYDQPFYYLGSGAQNFAFLSADGNYVLKFYREDRASHPLEPIAFLLPSIWKKHLVQILEKRKAKKRKAFTSYAIAFERLAKETGLLELHLPSMPSQKKVVTLYDKINVVHKIPLDRTASILQKRAEPFYPTLEKWINTEKWEEIEIALSELILLLRERCKKGIGDKDPNLETNFGFIGSHPIQIDVGRFQEDPTRQDPSVYRNDLIRITDHLCKWLDKKTPKLSEYVKKEIL